MAGVALGLELRLVMLGFSTFLTLK